MTLRLAPQAADIFDQGETREEMAGRHRPMGAVYLLASGAGHRVASCNPIRTSLQVLKHPFSVHLGVLELPLPSPTRPPARLSD